uniref:Uncharacterized protein n=1 Tax=Anguilla anguilla TaxID=7936 RepID=A0A0E9UQF0_ANGAN
MNALLIQCHTQYVHTVTSLFLILQCSNEHVICLHCLSPFCFPMSLQHVTWINSELFRKQSSLGVL